jgi:hypothetical protein
MDTKDGRGLVVLYMTGSCFFRQAIYLSFPVLLWRGTYEWLFSTCPLSRGLDDLFFLAQSANHYIGLFGAAEQLQPA